MSSILIIDDDPGIGYMLTRLAEEKGHTAEQKMSLKEGVQAAESGEYGLIFLDVFLPDGNGLDVLPKVKDSASDPEVIIVTGMGDPDGAEMALKCGAWDYIEKTDSMQHILLSMDRALKYRESRKRSGTVVLERGNMVGDGVRMRAALERIARAAAGKSAVLITGETGTGKELAARAIHHNSRLVGGDFVVVDCASLPKNLVENMLFGHVKGAYTGAHASGEGLVAAADKGTLFLDEIGELPMSMQKSFLRVLEERRYRPVGSKKESTSDFRLIAATNRDLDAMVEEGRFRKDLLFRIKSFTLELPPLRERMEDLRALVLHHVERICENLDLPVKGVSPEFMEVLTSYSWPGNVRELVQTLDQAVPAAGEEPMLYAVHLPMDLRVQVKRDTLAHTKPEPQATEKSSDADVGDLPDPNDFSNFGDYRKAVVAQAEKNYLQTLFEKSGPSIKKACELSGLSRTRLYYLMKEHDIDRKAYQ